jgi:1,4-alpha-glucan branching enzyme
MKKPKPPIQPVSKRFPAQELQEVVLTFFAPQAKAVQVAGTFNDWRPEANPARHLREGDWEVRLMLKSGQYEYRFVVDGVWTDDPEPGPTVPNPHGGRNSVITVQLDDRTDLL